MLDWSGRSGLRWLETILVPIVADKSGGGEGARAATHPLMVLRAESRFKYLMFSRMVERSPSPTCQCFSSHCTTVWLLSHR